MENVTARARGRPRAFDRDAVLDHAIITFWSRGYSGTSLDNLTDSMAISRPSLYAAFGSKHELFLEVIDRYAATLGGVPFSALKSGIGGRQAVADFFELIIRCATSKGKPKGCLIASVATFEAEVDDQVRDKVSTMTGEAEQAMAAYFQSAQEDGRLSGEHEPAALARILISVGHSIAARARAGASRKQLLVIADDFMAILFPGQGQD